MIEKGGRVFLFVAEVRASFDLETEKQIVDGLFQVSSLLIRYLDRNTSRSSITSNWQRKRELSCAPCLKSESDGLWADVKRGSPKFNKSSPSIRGTRENDSTNFGGKIKITQLGPTRFGRVGKISSVHCTQCK